MTDTPAAPPVVAERHLGPPGRTDLHLVLAHGYSCTETGMLDDLAGLQPHLGDIGIRLSSVRGWSPTKPGGRTYRWVGPGPGIGHPSPDLEESVARFIDVVAGLAADPVVLVGFSQGGALCSEVLRRRPDLVAALVMLSGYTLLPPRPADARLAERAAAGAGLPAHLSYDLADGVIIPEAQHWTAEFLRSHTALSEEVLPGLGHRIWSRQMPGIAVFLRSLTTRSDGAGVGGIP